MAEEKATFAGGCFWCMESAYEERGGLINVESGFTGGEIQDPTYEQVSSGSTKHVEAIQITYDPNKISYEVLLELFWKQIDPTDDGGQFVDRGKQYRSAIFYHSEEQQKLALSSKEKLEKSGRFKKAIVTEILPAGPFYLAEEYHQDYQTKNPYRYKLYRWNSGRDQFIEKHWKEDLKKRLTPLQYRVTQEDGTEPAYSNDYWDQKTEGIYVDVVSGEPLFASLHKYDSGTGWPSFWQPLETGNIVEKKDSSLFMTRIEVRSKSANSHLGHLFPDGPMPSGQRYCINSAALRFIPKDQLEKEGYGEYLKLF